MGREEPVSDEIPFEDHLFTEFLRTQLKGDFKCSLLITGTLDPVATVPALKYGTLCGLK